MVPIWPCFSVVLHLQYLIIIQFLTVFILTLHVLPIILVTSKSFALVQSVRRPKHLPLVVFYSNAIPQVGQAITPVEG